MVVADNLGSIHDGIGGNEAERGRRSGNSATNYTSKAKQFLQERGEKGIAGMANLREINVYDVQKGIDANDEGKKITIEGFDYSIINGEDMTNLPVGNYYDLKDKRFVVVNAEGNILVYAPYKRISKFYEKKTGKFFGRDRHLISGFIGKIGEVLSETDENDAETGRLLSRSSKYKGMIGRYIMGIGSFRGEVECKDYYGNGAGFEGTGVFDLFNIGVILTGHFTIKSYANTRKIYGSGRIKYPDGTVEIGSRGENDGLYERIYKKDDGSIYNEGAWIQTRTDYS